MGLRINTNIEAINVHNTLVNTNNRVSKSLERLSSGYRINSAKDDAAGFAVANSFKAKISSLNVAQQNVAEANSMLKIADGAYNKTHDILVRMKDIATQAASGQLETDSLSRLNEEFGYLQSEIDRISTSTSYSAYNAACLQLVSGDFASTAITFQVGSTNQADNQIAISFDAACTTALGVSSSGANAISVASQASAQAAMDSIDTALKSVNVAMAKVGSYQNRLDYTSQNLAVQVENFSASESTIRDVDMAAEMMEFTRNQILQQAGMAMLSQANMAPQQVLSIIG
jgi:flagellin